MTTVGDIVTQVAEHFGLDPVLCLADAWHESNLNPHAEGDDFGQGPSSFGLYQLHRGGELGTLTPEQAFNPTTNAMVALGTMAGFKAKTGFTGGALAAAAERPANPGAYAAVINSIIAQIKSGNYPVGYIQARDKDAGVPAPYPPEPIPVLSKPAGKPNKAQLTQTRLVRVWALGQHQAVANGWHLYYFATDHFVAQVGGQPKGCPLYANVSFRKKQ